MLCQITRTENGELPVLQTRVLKKDGWIRSLDIKRIYAILNISGDFMVSLESRDHLVLVPS